MPIEKNRSRPSLGLEPKDTSYLHIPLMENSVQGRAPQKPAQRDRREVRRQTPARQYPNTKLALRQIKLVITDLGIVDALLDAFAMQGDFASAHTLAMLAYSPRSSRDEVRQFVGEPLWQVAERHLHEFTGSGGLGEILSRWGSHA